MDSTTRDFVITIDQVFHCELKSDLDIFDLAFYEDAQCYAPREQLHLERIYVSDKDGGVYSFDTERTFRTVKPGGTISVQSGHTACRVTTRRYRSDSIEVTMTRFIPIRTNGWPPKMLKVGDNLTIYANVNPLRSKILTGGLRVASWILDWVTEHYGVEMTPKAPLDVYAREEKSIIGDDWQEIYKYLLERDVHVMKRFGLLPAQPPSMADVDQVTPSPGAGNPGRKAHTRARERLSGGESEDAVRADWRKDYEDETGMAPKDTTSGEKELWRNVKRGNK